jgi:membrane protein YqaA with SNARE-associated domain
LDNLIYIIINYGVVGIIIAAFAEAIFLPVTMEIISIPIYLANTNKALSYSIILILFSVLGSIAGYYLGKFFGKPLINKFASKERINKLRNLYNKNSFLTILTSSFTPIPYEAYVLSAGVFNIDFKKFLLASIISRVIRHLPQGIIIFLFGDALVSNIKNYTIGISIIVFVLILVKYLFTSRLNKNKYK